MNSDPSTRNQVNNGGDTVRSTGFERGPGYRTKSGRLTKAVNFHEPSILGSSDDEEGLEAGSSKLGRDRPTRDTHQVSDITTEPARRKRKKVLILPIPRQQQAATPAESAAKPVTKAQDDIVSLSSDEEKSGPEIKREKLLTQATTLLSPAILTNTKLYIKADTKPDQAAARISLKDCEVFNTLFDTLGDALLLPEDDGLALKMKKASIRYKWNNESLLIRKGKSGDWQEFCSDILEAWSVPERFEMEKGLCRVDVVVHLGS